MNEQSIPNLDSRFATQASFVAVAFQGLFGWLHLPQGLTRDTGVVVVSPLGRDERCVHLPVRLMCEQLAGAGFPILRYDHRGEGDSLDLADETGDAMTDWLAGIETAVATLRERTGVRRVVIGGMRLGGTLAAMLAPKADGLMLLAPVLNGKSWLNRLRFSAGAPSPRGDEGQSAIDSSGLYLSSATATSIARLDLPGLPAPAAPMFVAAQNALVSNYARDLRTRGAPITIGDFPGFDALFLDAHSNEAPQLVFDQAMRWLNDTFAFAPDSAPPRTLALSPAPPTELRHLHGRERPVAFGAGLQGILCLPDHPATDSPGVVFLNTGGDPRSGIGGFTTKAARKLAAEGYRSLRFDFAGLGDSPMPQGKQRSHIFETPREADMDAAIQFLADQGNGTVVVAGVCAGAYHAIRAAINDKRVMGVFAVSPVKLVWRKGDSLAFGRRDDGKATRAYFGALSDTNNRSRLFAGEVDVKTISRALAGRVKNHTLGMMAKRRSNSPLAGLRAFSRRGGRAYLLMGLDDISLDEVETFFGPNGRELKKAAHMVVDINPRLDHGLARRESQQIALSSLVAWLNARRAARIGQRAPEPHKTADPVAETSGQEVAALGMALDSGGR